MKHHMTNILAQLPLIRDRIKPLREVIISNILLLGQTPSPTFHEGPRIKHFLERLAESQADECTVDDFNNPIGIIKGTAEGQVPPIFVACHLDTAFNADVDYNYIVGKNTITGPGLLDNTASAGVLASFPAILKSLNIRFQSDIVIAGVIQSIGKGNLRGMRHLLNHWQGPVRGGVILEAENLGRLSYYSEGIIRGEIICRISATDSPASRYRPNAILIINDVINAMLAMNLPQRPRSRIIFGKISGGLKHGMIAREAVLGFELQSDSDRMVKKMLSEIKDIVTAINLEHCAELNLEVISTQNAATLKYGHRLVKSTVAIMKKLGLEPTSESSESELSVFLSKAIPAVTLGISTGKNAHLENASIKIEPMFTGIAQVIGVLMAIDNGVCDEI